MCIGETCRKQRLEEKKLPTEHFDTIFKIQDHVRSKSIACEVALQPQSVVEPH